jgi:hypothetical protein
LPGGDAIANIEALSSVSRTLNFRLTVRDNNPYVAGVKIGQTAFTDLVVTVSNTSGPFAVTAPNTNVTWAGGSSQTVTWSVNNTTAAPVSCASVNILLSTDGGNTFPAVLASATPNDGSQVVTIPSTPGTTNRVKVEAVGNIFFDISNTNFTIGAPVLCGDPTGLTSSAITQTTATVSWTAVSGATSYDVDYKANSSGTWINAATATTATSVNLTGLSSGTLYDWRVRATCPAGTGNYVQAQFTTVAPCNAPTGLSSSAITSSSATVSWAAVSGALNYDVDYKLASSGTWINSITGTTSTSRSITGLTASSLYDWRVRANCTGSSSAYAQAQFTTTAASTCPGPYDISTNGTTGGAATIPLNTDVKGLINPSGDNDYYRFVITTGGTITMTLTTLPANYQLRLLNSAGSTLQTSNNNGTNNETINATVAAGTYYARVYPRNNNQWNATICYTLRVQTGTASRFEEYNVNNIRLYPNPVDNILIVDLGNLSGKATIKIYDINGRIVIDQSANPGINRLYTNKLSSGLYFVKVIENNGNLIYNQKIVRQ